MTRRDTPCGAAPQGTAPAPDAGPRADTIGRAGRTDGCARARPARLSGARARGSLSGMVDFWTALTEVLGALAMRAEGFAMSFLTPGWRLWQLLIIAGLIAASWGVAGLASPRLRAWLKARDGWPKWRLRAAVVVRRRLGLIAFVALSYGVVLAMRELTWPSRSYLIALAAQVAASWLVISLAARVIRNGALRGAVTIGLAAWATARILGLQGELAAALDGAAVGMGEMRFSLLDLVTVLVVTGVLLTLAGLAARIGADRVRGARDMSPSMREFTVKVLQIAFYGLAIFLGLRAAGVDLTGLAVLSGAIGVGLGFGLQKVISNLISGLIILLDKSIKPGDVISLGETFGWIGTLGARYVSITTRDGREYLIPNEDLITNQVVNWSHSDELVRLDIAFGTSYDDDPHLVRRVAIDAARGVGRVLADRAPVCHITGFGDSSVDYILRFWIRDPSGGLTNIRGNVFLALWDAFKAHGISIPFPQRELRVLEPRAAADRPAQLNGARP